MGHGRLAVPQAQVDVRATADPIRRQHRGEDRPLSCPPGNRACQLAQHHRGIRSPHALLGRDRRLVLPWPVFGQEAVRFEAGRPHRRDQRLAETALPPESIQRIGRSRPVLYARQNEFLLEARHHREPGLRQRLQRPREERPRAEIPGAAVGIHNIAEIEPLRGPVIERHLDPHLRVRPDDQISRCAERRRVDRPEAGHHDIGVGQPHPLLQPHGGIRIRKRLATHNTGPVAYASENQRFRVHERLFLLWLQGPLHLPLGMGGPPHGEQSSDRRPDERSAYHRPACAVSQGAPSMASSRKVPSWSMASRTCCSTRRRLPPRSSPISIVRSNVSMSTAPSPAPATTR